MGDSGFGFGCAGNISLKYEQNHIHMVFKSGSGANVAGLSQELSNQ
jgi:hypothetical protein